MLRYIDVYGNDINNDGPVVPEPPKRPDRYRIESLDERMGPINVDLSSKAVPYQSPPSVDPELPDLGSVLSGQQQSVIAASTQRQKIREQVADEEDEMRQFYRKRMLEQEADFARSQQGNYTPEPDALSAGEGVDQAMTLEFDG